MHPLADRLKNFCDVSLSDKAKAVPLLQWLIVIGTSYFSLFSGGALNSDARVFALVVALLLSALLLQRLPPAAFHARYFDVALVIIDGAFILFGIGLNRESPWDLFLLFSLCVYLAGIAESLVKTLVGALLVTVGFTLINYSAAKSIWLDSEVLLRFPFLFGVSALYGYLAHQVKSERRRADQAEHAQTVRRRLVSGLAHDIKSPLSVIKGFADVVSMNLAGVPGQDYSLNAVQRIQDNVERILRLVTAFLDASRAEGGENQRLETPVALNWLIQEVVKQQSVDLRSNDVSLELKLDPALPEILGDVPQLERVIWNLVSNAIKFTPANGEITVTSERADDQVLVKVSDTGTGIARNEIPLLFSEYGRLPGASSTEGSGLGLYIVKNLVKAHGGTVDVESEPGQGATFTLRFPIASRQPRP
jgi:signal transduction histidine kinase